MKQSRFMSLVESIANIAVGYVLALATQVIVFPLFGIRASLPEHLAIGAAFTDVSVLRSYTLAACSRLGASTTNNPRRRTIPIIKQSEGADYSNSIAA